MVQNKKNFQAGRKMAEENEMQKKPAAKGADKHVSATRTSNIKDHKADIAKKDMGSRK